MQNFTAFIRARAVAHPDRPALVLPDYARLDDWRPHERVTFGGLWTRTAAFAVQLRAMGVAPGQRVLVLVPLSADLYAVVLAVLSLGATVVLVDAGLPRRAFAHCVKAARVHAAVGTRRVWRYRFVAPFLWRIPLKVTLDRPGPGLRRLEREGAAPDAPALAGAVPVDLDPVGVDPGQGALITFTSGSTGLPKGANRTQGTLSSQHLALAAAFPPPEGETAMTCFPVVTLHHLCCGVPTVLPALDLRDVASGRPEWIVRQIDAEGVDALTGGPAFFRTLTDHARRAGRTFPQVRRVGVGGAPVERALCAALRDVFPEADVAVLYGSTEAEPVASIRADEVLALYASGEAQGRGYPAGYAHTDVDVAVRLVRPHEGPVEFAPGETLAAWEVAPGAWGEVVVAGPHVNASYFENPAADRLHKIRDEEGRLWHRMGDVAHRDAEGRLWLGGRLAHLVRRDGQTFYPLQVAALLADVPGLGRTALHAFDGRVLLWLEGDPDAAARDAARAVLDAHGIPVDRVLTCPALPVDTRHRAKVDYPALDAMARLLLR